MVVYLLLLYSVQNIIYRNKLFVCYFSSYYGKQVASVNISLVQVAAQAGQRVHLVDIDADAVAKAQKRINESIQRVAKKKFKV